jgi:hypothetical protein
MISNLAPMEFFQSNFYSSNHLKLDYQIFCHLNFLDKGIFGKLWKDPSILIVLGALEAIGAAKIVQFLLNW